MTLPEFSNALRIMRSIDGYEVPGLDPHMVRRFVASPYETFLRMSDADQAEVWEAIKRRQPMRRRHKAAPGECEYCDREGDNAYHPPHDASPNCQSGGRSHCSCDTCF